MITLKDDNLTHVFIVAGCVLEKDGKFLLVQEKKPSVYEKWNLPAGKVEKGDTIEETAIKEAKEESGFDVKLIKKIGIFHESENLPIKHIFEAEIIGGTLIFPKDEILDAKWFSLEEISKMRDKLRGDFVYDAVDILSGWKENEKR